MKKGLTLIELLVIIAIIAIIAIFVSVIINSIHAKSNGVIGFGPDTAYACGGWFGQSCDSASGQAQAQQETVAQTLSKLTAQVPAPQLDNSLERSNISKRLTTFSDPAKISYIYLISYGKVMTYYVVKGKITSGGKRLTPQNQVTYQEIGTPDNVVVEAPELDGTYGNSSPYIFFWTTDGIYVQWSGDYMLTDQPMSLQTPAELVRSVK